MCSYLISHKYCFNYKFVSPDMSRAFCISECMYAQYIYSHVYTLSYRMVGRTNGGNVSIPEKNLKK